MGRRVLVTHADQPIGRCLVKLLFHDGDVDHVLATGHSPSPRSEDVGWFAKPARWSAR